VHSKVDIKAIIEEFGPPGYENARGQLTKLNECFWAAFFAKSRERIIFEPLEREFYDYLPESGLFIAKSADSIRTELAAKMYEASKTFDGYRALEQLRTNANMAAAVSHLRGQVEERNFFNQPFHYVHLGDCVLRFELDGTYSVEKFSPEHRSRNQSPICYDKSKKCPDFCEKLLGHLDEDDRILLQKYSGQCLLGRNLTQRFIILDGIGGSSKSALVGVLNGIVGPQNVYGLRTSLLDERFEIGRMIGRTLLIGPDVKGNFLSESGAHWIKALVGGDPLVAETKNSNQRFTIYGLFNLLITSNARLRIYLDGDESAWERRIIIVRYDRVYSGQRIFEIEKYLLEKEASGILNWCIEGLSMLYRDYAQAGDIILTAKQQTRVSDLIAESDSLRLFVRNEIVRDDNRMTNGQRYSLTTKEIIDEYINDCTKVKNWTPVSGTVAEKRLPGLMLQTFGIGKSHDIPRYNQRDQRGFWNVRFTP
jgi:putative DNA primase/helicase